jgi:epsilon-lactone hydrolase
VTQVQRSAARAMITKGDLGRTPTQQRAEFDEVFAERPLGDDITLTPRTLGGVPALDIQVEGADGDAVIFYLHGGGYVVGSARTGADLAAPLARRTGLPAVSLDYRLAPENPFPAAIDDALAAYRDLLGKRSPDRDRGRLRRWWAGPRHHAGRPAGRSAVAGRRSSLLAVDGFDAVRCQPRLTR